MHINGLTNHKTYNFKHSQKSKKVCCPYKSIPYDIFTPKYISIPAKISPLSFKGITQQLANTLYETAFQVENQNKKKDKFKDIVGNLPDQWLKPVITTSKDKEATIKKLYTEFGKATLKLQEPLKDISLSMENLTAFDIKIIYDKDIHIQIPMVRTYQRSVASGLEKAEKILTKALQQANIISKKDSINLQLIDVGKVGTAYKFSIDDKNYVFKVFHPFFDDQFPNPYHGRTIEINRAAFINKITKSIKDHNYTKFHFGDISKGYIISDFLDQDIAEPANKLNDEAYGFKFKDNNGNRNEINGHRYDMGGIVIDNPLLLTNKTMQWTYNQIMKDDVEGENNDYNRLKNWHELFNIAFKNKRPNCKDIMRALIDFTTMFSDQNRLNISQYIARTKFIDDDNKLAFSQYFIPKYEGKRIALPMDDIKNIYAILVRNSDGPIKEKLINQIEDFPFAHQIDFFEMFAYDSKDDKTKLILKQLIKKLPEPDQQKAKTILKRVSK